MPFPFHEDKYLVTIQHVIAGCRMGDRREMRATYESSRETQNLHNYFPKSCPNRKFTLLSKPQNLDRYAENSKE